MTFEVKKTKHLDGFVYYKHSFWITCVTCRFLCSPGFYSYSYGTHSLQRIRWWASDVLINYSDERKSLLMKKHSSTSWMAWGWVHFQQLFFIFGFISASDRWLNVWCIWHTYLETLQECRSRRRIGWIIQDFQQTCVSRSLTFHLETKMPWRQTPSRKKKAVVFTNVTANAYQDQLHAGFSKVCEIFKVCGI